MEDSIRIYEPFWDEWTLSEALYKDGNTGVYHIDKVGAAEKRLMKRISIPETEDTVIHLTESGLSQDEIRERVNAAARKVYSAYLKALAASFPGMLGYENCLFYAERGSYKLSYDLLIRAEEAVPLVDRLMDKALSADELLRLSIEVGAALCEFHSRGIVYGSLRPESVFLCPDGRFVLDEPFIAKAFAASGDPNAPAKIDIDTCAPEVAAGEEPDAISDVYSFGLLLKHAAGGVRNTALDAWVLRLCSSQRDDRPSLDDFISAMLELQDADKSSAAFDDEDEDDGYTPKTEFVGGYQPDYAVIDFGKGRGNGKRIRLIILVLIFAAVVAGGLFFYFTVSGGGGVLV